MYDVLRHGMLDDTCIFLQTCSRFEHIFV